MKLLGIDHWRTIKNTLSSLNEEIEPIGRRSLSLEFNPLKTVMHRYLKADDSRIDFAYRVEGFPSFQATVLIANSDHQIRLVLPAIKEIESSGLETILASLARLPAKLLHHVDEIEFNPTGSLDGFLMRADGLFGLKEDGSSIIRMSFGTLLNDKKRGGILQHELGHALALNLFGTTTPGTEWMAAIRADKFKVSAYAGKNPAEDFAETVKAYIRTDGGRKNPLARRMYKNRFLLLDRYFEANPGRAAEAVEEAWKSLLTRASIPLAAAGGWVVYYEFSGRRLSVMGAEP